MGFKVILSKELKRVFSDRKMIFSMFIMPVLMIGIIFFVMFNLVKTEENSKTAHISTVCVQNAPEELKSILKEGKDCEVTYLGADDSLDEAKDRILNGKLDLIIEFPADFTEVISGQDKNALPQVKTFYNPSEDNSAEARTRFVEGYLETYRMLILQDRFGSLEYVTAFAVDNDNPDMVIQDNEKATGKILGMIVPYFIAIMIFAGAMGLGIDTIAGEKERGTMANLLISPVKRVDIVMGKVVGLGIVSVASAAVYIISLAGVAIFGMNKAGMGDVLSELSFNFTIEQILQFGILLIGIVLLYVGLIAITSLLAKNNKEAQSFILPVYLVVMISGMVTMYAGGASETSYMIPLYNTSIAFKGIFARTITMNQFLTVTLITYAFAFILVYAMTRIIKSEKIMLNA